MTIHFLGVTINKFAFFSEFISKNIEFSNNIQAILWKFLSNEADIFRELLPRTTVFLGKLY